MTMRMTRREFAVLAGPHVGAAALAPPALRKPRHAHHARHPEQRRSAAGGRPRHRRKSSTPTTRRRGRRRPRSSQALVADGGRLIDTASTYGDAESVLGDVIAAGRPARQALHRHQTRGARRRRTQALAGPAQDRQARPAAAPQRARSAAIAGAVQGLEDARRVPLYRHHLDLPRRFCRGRSGAAAREAGFRRRSTIRSTTAKPKSASCRWRPRSRPAC